MNKRQWKILAAGGVAIVSIIMLGTSRHPPTASGPVVEYAPGHYSQSFTGAVMPTWVVLAGMGFAALTGASMYGSRSQRNK